MAGDSDVSEKSVPDISIGPSTVIGADMKKGSILIRLLSSVAGQAYVPFTIILFIAVLVPYTSFSCKADHSLSRVTIILFTTVVCIFIPVHSIF